MPDTPSHFSVSSPSLSKGLPFFATLASVKPGVNYGPIINVAGLPFSWTPSGYEPSSGAFPFETLSSLLASSPQPGMRATALDAPGSMLYEVGGKWGGDLGLVSSDPALTALPTANMGLVCACLENPLTPLGRTRMCLASGIWMPEPGQILYRAKGSLLDRTASGLSLGVWAEVWQSPILPGWMFVGSPNISLSSEAEIADPSSTAVAKIRIRISSVGSTTGDENDAFFGCAGATNVFGKGISSIRARGSIVGTNLFVNSGAQPSSTATQPHRLVGTVNDTSTRIRFDAAPGAATNTIKLFSAELWSGS